jgi:hypothetical protein
MAPHIFLGKERESGRCREREAKQGVGKSIDDWPDVPMLMKARKRKKRKSSRHMLVISAKKPLPKVFSLKGRE